MLGDQSRIALDAAGMTSAVARTRGQREGQSRSARHPARLLVSLSPCLLVFLIATAAAEPRTDATTLGATSERAARDEAIRAIPWKQLAGPPGSSSPIRNVESCSRSSEIPACTVGCRPV